MQRWLVPTSLTHPRLPPALQAFVRLSPAEAAKDKDTPAAVARNDDRPTPGSGSNAAAAARRARRPPSSSAAAAAGAPAAPPPGSPSRRSLMEKDEDKDDGEADPLAWAARGHAVPTFLTAFDNEFVHFFKVRASQCLGRLAGHSRAPDDYGTAHSQNMLALGGLLCYLAFVP